MARIVLLSTYDLGRSPFGLASPAAWLRAAGCEVRCCDLAVGALDEDAMRAADLVALHVPMHTATRLALRILPRLRSLAPRATFAAFGLYAAANAEVLRAAGVTHAISGEFEAELVALAMGRANGAAAAVTRLDRLEFLVPDRSDLPPLERYARLRVGDVEKVVGATEASRGCKHLCRHCPVVPVYGGRFRIVPREVVLADVRQQVAAGATHVTFGDPDFLNGPGHALPLVRALHEEFPTLTYDVTIKVEHLLRHAEALPVLRETGCAFVVSAVEAFDDRILAALAKGHTRADFERALGLCRDAGLVVQPTFVAFTPWTTLAGYGEMLSAIDELDLVEAVAPVQLGLRLLVPAGSRLLERDDVRGWISAYDATGLVHRWTHDDSRVDALQRTVQAEVERRALAGEERATIFEAVRDLAGAAGANPRTRRPHARAEHRAPVPFLTEPWYC